MLSFVAECPQCEARLRVPASRTGEAVRCPRCEFEIEHATPAPEPTEPAAPAEEDPPPNPHDDPLRMALIAVTLAGAATLASQIPYGRGVTILGSAIGLGLAALSLLGLERRRWLGATAAALNGVVLLLAIVAPGWLGASRSLPEDDGPKTPLAVAFDGSPPRPADWVDADRAAWQHNDVRAAVSSVGLVPEPAGKGAKRTKDRPLRVVVTVTNVGVSRGIDVTPWAAGPPAEARLTSADGTPRAAVPDPDARPKTTLYPGKSAECVLLFAAPPGAPTDLRLELPAEAFGGTDPIRFRIPARMIAGPRQP